MAPPGETCLAKLLATLTTSLHEPTYVFATLAPGSPLPPLDEVQLLFREKKPDAVTVIVTEAVAAARGLEYSFPCKMITLNVHSSLEAIGFMAVIATRLAACNMGVNPVSAFYHDHLFVPLGREAEAIAELTKLADEKRAEAT